MHIRWDPMSWTESLLEGDISLHIPSMNMLCNEAECSGRHDNTYYLSMCNRGMYCMCTFYNQLVKWVLAHKALSKICPLCFVCDKMTPTYALNIAKIQCLYRLYTYSEAQTKACKLAWVSLNCIMVHRFVRELWKQTTVSIWLSTSQGQW